MQWIKKFKNWWITNSKTRIFWIRLTFTIFAIDVFVYLQLVSIPFYSLIDPFYFLNAPPVDKREKANLYFIHNNFVNKEGKILPVSKNLYRDSKILIQARVLINELSLGSNQITVQYDSSTPKFIKKIWQIDNKLVLDVDQKWYHSKTSLDIKAIEKTLISNLEGITQVLWSISKGTKKIG